MESSGIAFRIESFIQRSSILVLAEAPNRKCCLPLLFAEFPTHQLCSRSRVLLIWLMSWMAPVTGSYNFHHAELDNVGLPSPLLGY